MTEQELFQVVGIREEKPAAGKKVRQTDHFPWISVVLLAVIVLCCLFAEVLMTKSPTYLDLQNCNVSPNAEFLFGTDTLGRDIFSGIWYGGRISITIGFFATLISTAIAVVYGSVSGIAPVWLDTLMMRFTEIFLSVPSLLLVLFVLPQMLIWGDKFIRKTRFSRKRHLRVPPRFAGDFEAVAREQKSQQSE